MSAKYTPITQELLKENLDYDIKTGIFKWSVSKFGGAAKGSIAGTKRTEYISIQVLGKSYAAHRLAWLYIYGEFPLGVIDHINKNTKDNRMENLRDVSRSINGRNSKRQINNKSGVVGVRWDAKRNKWTAQIQRCGLLSNLGSFDNFDDAVKKRKYAESRMGFHPNHGVEG